MLPSNVRYAINNLACTHAYEGVLTITNIRMYVVIGGSYLASTVLIKAYIRTLYKDDIHGKKPEKCTGTDRGCTQSNVVAYKLPHF